MLVGSNVFFKDIDGFVSKDVDILELVDNPTDFKYIRQFRGNNKCVFQWKKMNADEFIEISLKRGVPMEIGKFLVPEFVQVIGFNIDHLKKLQVLADNLDDKHKYEKIIYDAYIENNTFELSEEQRKLAYSEYLLYREN